MDGLLDGFAGQNSKIDPSDLTSDDVGVSRAGNLATGPLEPFLDRNAGLRLGPWKAEAYILYEAFLRPEGSVYEPVVHYPLEPGP